MRRLAGTEWEHVSLLCAALAEGAFGAAFYGYGPLFMREALGWTHLSRVTLTTGVASFVTFVAAAAWGRQGDRTGRPLALAACGLGLMAMGLAALSVTRGAAAFLAEAVATTAALAAVPALAPTWLTLRHPDRPAQAAAGFYRARTGGWFAGSLSAGLCVRQFGIAVLPHIFQAVAAWSLIVGTALWLANRREERRRLRVEAWAGGVGGHAGVIRRDAAGAEPSRTTPSVTASQVGARPAEAAGLAAPAPVREAAAFAPVAAPGDGAVAAAPAPHMPAAPAPLTPGRRPARRPGGRAWRNPAVWGVALCLLFVASASEAFFALLGPYLTEYLHGSRDYVGFILAASSALGIAVLGPVGRLADRYGPERVLRAGALGYVLMFAVSIAVRDPLVTSVVYTLPMYPLVTAGAMGWLAYRTPREERGEAVGICEGTAALAAALGAVGSGAVADAWGLAWLPVASLVAAGVGLGIAWLAVRPANAAAARG